MDDRCAELLAAAQDVLAVWDSDRISSPDKMDFASFGQRAWEFGLRYDAAKDRLRAAVGTAQT